MSAPKFTPGPWEIGDDDSYIVAPNEPHRAIVAIVAESDSSLGRTPERVAANGRLIAAAPAMYEALRTALLAIVHSIDCAQPDGPCDCEEKETTDELASALAKADGVVP